MAIFDNGMAPVSESANVGKADVPRSAFNMSRVHHCTMDIGTLCPVDVMETLPNEDYTINYASMVETRNPLLAPLKSGLKMIFHTYWSPKRELWKGWDNYIDKGRSGTHTASVPKLYPAIKTTVSSGTQGYDHDPTNDLTTLTPMSVADYMGVPIVAYDNTRDSRKADFPTKVTSATKVNNGYGADSNNNEKWGINALPFVMYNKIYRDYYANQNLLQDNKQWLPDDEETWILPYTITGADGYTNNMDGTITTFTTGEQAMFTDHNSYMYVPSGDTNGKNIKPILNVMHYRQFRGDYFTTANPFADLLRGNKDALTIEAGMDYTEAFKSGTYNALTTTHNQDTLDGVITLQAWGGNQYNYTLGANTKSVGGGSTTSMSNKLLAVLNRAKATGISLSALRKACVLEKFMQRNATTQGTYREFIGAQFGYMPNVFDRKPRYVGGSTMDINCNQVTSLQTQGLGTKGGNLEGTGMNNIGKYHSDDYGYLMTIACIVPDVYYDNQGLDTMWTRTEQDLEYYPLLNNLEPQAVKNKELYVSGNSTYDEDVWGYANRFEDMKSRRNIITGLGATTQALNDNQGWIKRRFDNNGKPQLHSSFMAMSEGNINLIGAGFSSNNEVPFNVTLGCCIDKVSPMPFVATPADLGLKY